MVEAGIPYEEAFAVNRVCGGCDRGQAATVKRSTHGNDPISLALALRMEVAANCLEATLDCLGAGVAEEDTISECARYQFARQFFARFDVIEVGCMPQALCLIR